MTLEMDIGGRHYRWVAGALPLSRCARCGRRTTGELSRRGWSAPCCTGCVRPLAEREELERRGARGGKAARGKQDWPAFDERSLARELRWQGFQIEERRKRGGWKVTNPRTGESSFLHPSSLSRLANRAAPNLVAQLRRIGFENPNERRRK